MSVDPRRTRPFCDARCYRECRCSRWPSYVNRFGFSVAGSYASKVLGYGPIAYWPLWEQAGIVAECLVNSAQNGTYAGVTLADDTSGPFSTPAPYFDGANDFVNVHSATFASAFNGSTGSMMWWFRVPVAAWTDGTARAMVRFSQNATNYVRASKAAAANSMFGNYVAGAVSEVINPAESRTVWINGIFTWDKPGDEVELFVQGVSAGTSNTLGVWGANPLSAAFIGVTSAVPADPFHGWQAHFAVWDRVLGTTEITDLAVAS